MGEHDDRRDDDRLLHIVQAVGRIEGGQQAATKAIDQRFDGVERTIRTGQKEAKDSRDDIHRILGEFRKATAEEFASVKKRLTDVEKMAEQTMNDMTLVHPTIDEHEAIKQQGKGAVIAVKQMGKMFYILVVAAITAVGASYGYVVHVLMQLEKLPPLPPTK